MQIRHYINFIVPYKHRRYISRQRKTYFVTNIYSSRMRTARLLPVSPSMHCAGGGGCLLPGGCLLLEGFVLLGGVCSWGVYSQGVSALGGFCSWGVCLLLGVGGGGCVCSQGVCPGGCIPACTEADTPLWTEWLTDRCKNITFANFVCGR